MKAEWARVPNNSARSITINIKSQIALYFQIKTKSVHGQKFENEVALYNCNEQNLSFLQMIGRIPWDVTVPTNNSEKREYVQ